MPEDVLKAGGWWSRPTNRSRTRLRDWALQSLARNRFRRHNARLQQSHRWIALCLEWVTDAANNRGYAAIMSGGTEPSEASNAGKIIPVMLAIGGLLLLGLSLGQHYWENVRTHAVETCLHMEVPPGSAFDEPPFDLRVIWWPMGVQCTFNSAASDRPITIQSDWGLTIAALTGVGLLVGSVAVIIVRQNRKQRPEKPTER